MIFRKSWGAAGPRPGGIAKQGCTAARQGLRAGPPRRMTLKGVERIEIDRRYCKGCMLCQYVCKYDVFEPGQERSALDYLMPRPSRPENCRLCRLCESHCPDMALVVVAPQGPGKGKGKK